MARIREWARQLPAGASVLELGCGHGVPVSAALAQAGLIVHGVDASPTLVAHFARRFPAAPVACERVQTSTFFDRTFDAAVMVGLLFLLPPADQLPLLDRVAAVLRPGGRFLFTAPARTATWSDLLTGWESVSLGREVYATRLAAAGFDLLAEDEDEGGNHCYDARKA